MTTLNDFMTSSNNNGGADKTALFKAIMPCDYTYSPATQEVVITGAAKDVQFRYEMKGDNLLINYIKGTTKIAQWINNPYNNVKNPEGAINAVGKNLVYITKIFNGTLDGSKAINNFQDLIDATIGTADATATANVLCEFKNEEVDFNDPIKKYTNFVVPQIKEGKWLSKSENLDVSKILKNTLTVIVEENTNTEESSSSNNNEEPSVLVASETDLLDLLG